VKKDLLFVAAAALTVACMLPAPVRAHDVGANPIVDRKAGVPTVLSFDVKGGTFNYVLDPTEPDEEQEKSLRIRLSAPTDVDWLAGHWYPTAFLCLKPAGRDAKQSYCANITFNDATQAFGSARQVSEQGEQLFRKLTSRLFDANATALLRVARKGTHVTTTINGEVIDESEIDFVPDTWMIGASTGVAHIEVLVPPDDEVELGRSEWPRTLDAAVDEAISHLSAASKRTLREMPKEDLANFWIGWGTSLRDRQGLSRGNDALRKAACGIDCAPDAAARAILEAVWTTLKEQPER
jgi:hypothetical protein